MYFMAMDGLDACMNGQFVCAVTLDTKQGYEGIWNWNHRWLYTGIVCMQRIDPESSQ